MRKVVISSVIAVALAAGVGTAPAASAATAMSRPVLAHALSVDGTQIFTVFTDAPSAQLNLGAVQGLTVDTKLVGIDVRVQDGALYGVGNAGGVYRIDPKSKTATKVLTLSVPLEGTAFGVDFNPAANALRVVSNTGQNLRQPFATAGAATIADTRLSTPPTAGDTTGVGAAAYTNNDLDATTGTTLFDLNTTTDALVIQSPANNGTLAAVGSLGIDAGPVAGLDIYTNNRGVNTGYAVVAVDGATSLYTVDLLNGRATKVGTFRTAASDIAIPLAGR